MFTITIYRPEVFLTDKQFILYCEHFNCVARKNKYSVYWNVSSEDPLNFYWLGMNLNHRSESNLTETVIERIIRENT